MVVGAQAGGAHASRRERATKWLPKWLGCEPRLIPREVTSLQSGNPTTSDCFPPIAETAFSVACSC